MFIKMLILWLIQCDLDHVKTLSNSCTPFENLQKKILNYIFYYVRNKKKIHR